MRTTKERPIIFSTEMVRAILEGRKTQTRRVIKPQPEGMDEFYFRDFRRDFGGRKCPHGQVGDGLWVKETYYQDPGGGIWYRADNDEWLQDHESWRTPLFMPRWASRITLEITGLRVERLQDITQRDAVNEGVIFMGGMFDEADQAPWCPSLKDQEPMASPRDAYGRLWDSLNAKRGYAWESNPWVWVIEFKRLSD